MAYMHIENYVYLMPTGLKRKAWLVRLLNEGRLTVVLPYSPGGPSSDAAD